MSYEDDDKNEDKDDENEDEDEVGITRSPHLARNLKHGHELIYLDDQQRKNCIDR